MDCESCNKEREDTIIMTTKCCDRFVCIDCFLPRTGKCNESSCDEIHYSCILCGKVSNIPKHIFEALAYLKSQECQLRMNSFAGPK